MIIIIIIIITTTLKINLYGRQKKRPLAETTALPLKPLQTRPIRQILLFLQNDSFAI